jgi:predicted Fe-S protein YdhL (DUF1289 family)
MKETDKAYVAGFIDRSAFIGIIKAGRRYSDGYMPRIVMQSNEPTAFNRIKELCGGCLMVKKDRAQWILQGRKHVASVLAELLPYLIVRKRSAEKIIQFNNEWIGINRYMTYGRRAEILGKRDMLVIQSLGLKPTWKREPRGNKPTVYEWEKGAGKVVRLGDS